MTLSVLSAIARQDVDPWTEAARLSQLPKETAIKQIIDLLDGLPRRTLACLDRVEVAARLSALLPTNAAVKMSGMLQSLTAARQSPQSPAAPAFNWRFFYLYLCLMLVMNWLMAEFSAPAISPTASGTTPGIVTKAPESASTPNSLGNTLPTANR